ncbi:MAG: carboxypeptidase regulatory-like domain-containing protein [Janthinobacterium lividum]
MQHRTSLATTLTFAAALSATGHAMAQQCTGSAGRMSVEILDSTGAQIVGAQIAVDGQKTSVSDAHGQWTSACLAAGPHRIRIAAEGFAVVQQQLVAGAARATVKLRPVTVETSVDAVQDEPVSTESVAGTKTLEAKDIKQLADDPDEFQRQLQVLAAAAGGAPGQAIIAVDGFQNGGRIPPKSAIAFIRINPDLFSAEYERAPYQGGRVEIYTKPGQSKLHGALFTTQSAQFLNAKDPFAPSRAAIGKQRYGFELGGPIRTNRSDFFVALEHRQIDQFAVVNAVTLDAGGNATQTTANVPTPQSLWEGSVRLATLLNAHNNLTTTYTATVNGLVNLGVGGSTLQQAGYDSQQAEHAIRLTNLQTISATTLHETRVGLTFRNRDDSPLSTAPSLVIAGAFTGGGATTQALRSHEFDLEVDDDVLYQHRAHNLKFGVELLNAHLDDRLPSNFNGTYIFGGGTAPVLGGVGTTTISGLEQYRRALAGLPGGNATQYAVTIGSAPVSLNQLRVVPYVQDICKLNKRLEVSLGLRYALQSSPNTFGNIAPRMGVAWSPDRRQRWVLHARAGLFYTPIDAQTTLETYRLNGMRQTQLQINNPAYGAPMTTGTGVIATLRTPLPSLSQIPSVQTHFGVEHEFPGHWHAQANLYLARAWNDLRSRNINAPLNGAPTGPRPFAANTNLYQYQQTGGLGGNVLFVGVDQHSLKHLQIFAGYIHMNLKTNADTPATFPQSSYTNAGEYARPIWLSTHQLLAFTNYVFPLGIVLSNQFNAASGNPYNVTTGFDSNGDGIFNDRPRFAAASDSGATATQFGTLSNVGNGASITRNAGTLPWNVHLDGNLSRTFSLPHAAPHEAQTIAFNLRSTNLLNHTNGTAVGGVLGSPLFGRTYAADPGRRIEVGLRYSF